MSARVSVGRRMRPFRRAQAGYIGIGNRRAVGGGQTWQQYIRSLLDGSEFFAPLTHTAVPTRAASGTTGTFTRATTSTWPNNDGYMVTGVAGEIGFPGARRVYNQVSIKSDDNTVGSAVSANVTVAATTIAFNSANASYWYKGSVGNSIVGHTYMVRAMASCTVDRTVCFRALELSGGGVVSNVALTSTPQEISLVFTASVVGTIIWGVENRVVYASDTGTSGVITFTDLQIADVTAETDQTTPREYVSVGVESAPYYHGSMVDGVKCFPTDISGNPIPSTTLLGYQAQGARTNLCLQSNALTTTWASTLASVTQNAVGPDGGTTAWTLNDTDVGSIGEDWQNITLTAAPYTMSAFVKKTSGATTFPVMYVITGTVLAVVTIDTNNGVATVWTAYTGFTMLASASARCASYNSNYWRVELTYTATAAVYHHAVVAAGTTNATQSTGTLSATVIGSAVFYGVQVELGSFATPYIPTTTVAVARNSDVLTYTGADVANIKTLCATFRRESGVASTGVVLELDDGGGLAYNAMYLTSATNLRFEGRTTGGGGAIQWQVNASNAYTPGASSKSAVSAATNDIKMAFSGVAQTADTSATLSPFTQLSVGYSGGTGGLQLSGNVGGIYGWTRNLSQSEENAVTA